MPSAEARRGTVVGTPVWARFCPGPDGHTMPAEIPSDALTTHIGQLAALTGADAGAVESGACADTSGRTYRLQVGYADGHVAQITGRTDPDCPGTVAGGDAPITGPEGLGVYGSVMSAFGDQYAASFDPASADAPLTCPDDPLAPDSVDLDGASASLTTGWHLGRRAPMVMPLAAVRGLVCTWPDGQRDPTTRDLAGDEAERVRVGLHAVSAAMVDCEGSRQPTYTAVVEDRTGTRRAVTIIDAECSTVVRSDGGYGLGFAWLAR